MSTETSEKTYYQAKRERLAAALTKWQQTDTGEPAHQYADDLEDILLEYGLQILPTAATNARYRVLIDGQVAPYIGQTRPAGPVDANDAAEMFLVAALGAEEADGDHQVAIRPATDAELVTDLLGGA
ncbi:hypothetical protein [Streptosporangium saharense]|uniref:hypothetical protein n=1 Tax=Streptosporangium saharense TaxID=1706840 RepID=UPI003317012F